MVTFWHATSIELISTADTGIHVMYPCPCSGKLKNEIFHSQIVLMQKFALISFFAQAPQPMFTHKVIERMGNLVLVRTVIAEWAMSFPKRLAKWPVGIHTKAIFSFEKVGEAELIRWG